MLSDAEITQFLDDCLMLNTVEAVAFFASSSDAYHKLRYSIQNGTCTGSDMEAFVQDMLRDFRPGTVFYGDKLLALIAQVVVFGPVPFASHYLNELSNLDCGELPISTRVAKLSLRTLRSMS